MIRLAPTKNLVDEEQVDTVIPCPQRLFQPVQSFLEFTHMELCPFLYKPLRLIHVDLYLQYFIQKWFFHVYLVELPVHGCSNCKNASNDDELGHMGKSLVKIHSSYFEISILNRTLCLKFYPMHSSSCGTSIYTLHFYCPLKVAQFPRIVGYEQVVHEYEWPKSLGLEFSSKISIRISIEINPKHAMDYSLLHSPKTTFNAEF